MTAQPPGTAKRRSKAWLYYAVLSVLSFIAACSGQVIGLVGTALFGLYSVYLYRGGRFVFWFW
jgi:hypothetical protein